MNLTSAARIKLNQLTFQVSYLPDVQLCWAIQDFDPIYFDSTLTCELYTSVSEEIVD